LFFGFSYQVFGLRLVADQNLSLPKIIIEATGLNRLLAHFQ